MKNDQGPLKRGKPMKKPYLPNSEKKIFSGGKIFFRGENDPSPQKFYLIPGEGYLYYNAMKTATR